MLIIYPWRNLGGAAVKPTLFTTAFRPRSGREWNVYLRCAAETAPKYELVLASEGWQIAFDPIEAASIDTARLIAEQLIRVKFKEV